MPKKTAKTALTVPNIDKNLLDGAVDFINRAVHASSIQLAVARSEYVIDTFFAGDPRLLSSKDPDKTASFRALCDHPQLQMSAATLFRLVRVGQQARHLPSDLAENLTQAQHRALLAVPDPRHKQHLARQAVQHRWTAEQLTSQIAAEHPPEKAPQGRPHKPELLKWLGAVRRSSGEPRDSAVLAEDFAKLTADEQAKFKADLTALQAEWAKVLAAIG